jgi:hypothetical protein
MDENAGRTRVVLLLVRYGLPGALILTGLILLVADDSRHGLDAWAMFTGSGLAVLLLNLLFRLGVEGDRERDEEDAARAFLDEHGYWPDEDPSAARHRRRPSRDRESPRSGASHPG